jgi:GT2 family glycosyltransferase
MTLKARPRPLTPPSRRYRPEVRGKFLYDGDRKLYLRGVTYGTFRPTANGEQFPPRTLVERDFEEMRAAKINAVRTYTVPPAWLLDLAHAAGLLVLVGIPWEQHTTFLSDRSTERRIVDTVRKAVRSTRGHPAVLAYVIGNEIPGPIVRWHGARAIERFLRNLCAVVRRESVGALVTYVNYPTTEYLDLPFLDFVCFNVYLESPDALRAYLARLQNLSGDRPLVMAEIGLDSRRHGLHTQAESLRWQLREVFAEGCAGAFVFSWTDEWFRGGYDIEDWDFGLTGRDRVPKPALKAVADAFEQLPFPDNGRWPRVSIVICSYNGARTITDTFEALRALDYPDFEVILVDDGSRDETAAIGRWYGARVISTENRGLSSARNTGCEAATGEIVAYVDDDAYPDRHWLKYLVHRFLQEEVVGVGGPNLPPPGDGAIAECVAHAPGGPVHVLLADTEAEHIPGCNMAFRREALVLVNGFDPVFRAAGDDVDLCWRLIDAGGRIGFHAGALVWHHRRNSLRTYWRQQRGYGRAEALLERKWPEKYNGPGHLSWAGRLYGAGLTSALKAGAGRVYQGHAGTALFQSVYEPATGLLRALPLMPEWYLVVASLALITALGALWWPLLLAAPLLVAALLPPIGQSVLSALRAPLSPRRRRTRRGRLRLLIATLHLVQPLARLSGRLEYGLSPWRTRGQGLLPPLPRRWEAWSETWHPLEERASLLADALRRQGAAWTRGGDYDRWDFEVRGGLFGSVRFISTLEEHGAGRQMARVRAWARTSVLAFSTVGIFGGLALAAATSGAWIAAGVLGLVAKMVVLRLAWEASRAMGIAGAAVASYREKTA